MRARLAVEQLPDRLNPAPFTGAGFATDHTAVYGFVGPLQDAFGRTDGIDWHAVAGGTGNGPRVVVEDIHTGAVVADFLAFEESFRGGVVMEGTEVAGEGDRLLVGAGTGGAPLVRQFDPLAGTECGPAIVFGDPDRDRQGVSYLNSTQGQVFATLGAGAGPRLFGADPLTGRETASVLMGPEGDRSGLYNPINAGLGVRGPGDKSDPYLLGAYVDGPDYYFGWVPIPSLKSAV